MTNKQRCRNCSHRCVCPYQEYFENVVYLGERCKQYKPEEKKKKEGGETMNNFAEELKQARAATGLSQQGMADRMLIPKRTIQDWEGGQRTPPPYVQRFVLNELRGRVAPAQTEGGEQNGN